MRVIKSVSFLWLVALALLLSACEGLHAQERETRGLQTYVGDGFSLQYPANAQVERASTDPATKAEIHIIGPDVSVKPGDGDWVYSGPAYEMIILTFDNPGRLDTEAWARNHILTSWQQAKERGEPLMGPLVSESGKIIEDQVCPAVVAAEPAFRADFLAGDSYRRTFFLSRERQIVALSFYDYPLENQPLAMVQQDVYAFILSTFRFEKR